MDHATKTGLQDQTESEQPKTTTANSLQSDVQAPFTDTRYNSHRTKVAEGARCKHVLGLSDLETIESVYSLAGRRTGPMEEQ
jgi:hypothetical protein